MLLWFFLQERQNNITAVGCVACRVAFLHLKALSFQMAVIVVLVTEYGRQTFLGRLDLQYIQTQDISVISAAVPALISC